MAAEGRGLGRKSSEQTLKDEGAGISANDTKHERREEAGTREKALEETITEMEGQKSEGGAEKERERKEQRGGARRYEGRKKRERHNRNE